MPISAYTGLPRHGKSYGVVENVIVPALKQGRKIYTNIPMHNDICLERFKNQVIQFEIQDIIDNKNWFTEVFEKGALFIADELWELWPSGLKANNALVQHKTFLAKHGHLVGEDGYSTNIVFVTQDLGQIAAFARCLVETTYIVEKLINVGANNRYRVDVFAGSQTGLKPPVTKRINEIQGSFKKEIFELYVSHTESTNGAGNENLVDQRFNILKGSKIKMLGFGFLSFVFVVVFLANHFISSNHYFNDENASPAAVPKQAKENKSSLHNSQFSQIKKKEEIVEKKEIALDKINDVLANSDSIEIVGSIIMESDKKSFFYYKVIDNDAYAFLTKKELSNLGYTVTIVNNCLSTIKGFDKAYYAMCTDSSISSKGLIAFTK